MPCVGLKFVQSPENVLQGELVDVDLEITNYGNTTATDLLLKTSLPWLRLRDNVQSPHSGDTLPGGLLGTSATTLCLGRDLHAGESVHVPAIVRGSGGGLQTLRLILKYFPEHGQDTVGGNPGSGQRPARYMRHIEEICVHPSAAISAEVQPAVDDTSQYILTLEVSNYRALVSPAANGEQVRERSSSERDAAAGHDLLVSNVRCLSKAWALKPLGWGTEGMLHDASAAEACSQSWGRLHWQEHLSLHFRVYPHPPVGGNDSGSMVSDVPICTESIDPRISCETSLEVLAAETRLSLTIRRGFLGLCLAARALPRSARRRELSKQRKLVQAEPSKRMSVRSIQDIRRANQQQAEQRAGGGDSDDSGTAARRALPCTVGAMLAAEGPGSLVHLVVEWATPKLAVGPGQLGRAQMRGQHHLHDLVVRSQEMTT
eukprot:scaffold30_cov255-Pinguiococcus_pyrenoidosus.AAC.28